MDGQIIETYEYDAAGKTVIRNKFGTQIPRSEIGNCRMFTAREYDTETGNYYYRARFYSPTLGRFLQTDPIGYSGGLNLYTYCYNNPIIYVDNDGQSPTLISGGIGALAGAVIGGGSYAIFHEGDWSWSQFGGSVAGGAVTGGLAGLTCGASLLTQTAVGGVASAVGYGTNVGVSQLVTAKFGEENVGTAKEWSTSEFAGSVILGTITAGVAAKYNSIGHVPGAWPTTLKTALTGAHAQALYLDNMLFSGTVTLASQAGQVFANRQSQPNTSNGGSSLAFTNGSYNYSGIGGSYGYSGTSSGGSRK